MYGCKGELAMIQINCGSRFNGNFEIVAADKAGGCHRKKIGGHGVASSGPPNVGV
jgi:hypothetical protein